MKICEKLVRLTPNAKRKTASEASQRAIAADKKQKKRVKSGVAGREWRRDECAVEGGVTGVEEAGNHSGHRQARRQQAGTAWRGGSGGVTGVEEAGNHSGQGGRGGGGQAARRGVLQMRKKVFNFGIEKK